MEQLIKILIYIHAFFGGIGLITGFISILVKKGERIHERAGKLFSYAILISSLIALFVSRMPRHENLFLFLIGVFTIYLVLAGNRALTLKSKIKPKADWIDKSISGGMLTASVIMLLVGIIEIVQQLENSILYIVFGGFGLFMSLKDLKTYTTFHENKNAWLVSHIGRMVGAFIASITAFIVAGLSIGTVAAWVTPSIVGTIYIIYWTRKIKATK